MGRASVESGERDDLLERLLPTTIDGPPPSQHLPLPLSLLFGLNGVALSLPITALLYIVNTRASVPVALLSAYGAVAFLPCSLKPLYAYASQLVGRNALLVLFLVTGGVCSAATSQIPHDGVVWCFLLGFLRGLTSAWPEFLLGLCLIERARLSSNYEVAAARLQSEAATTRNFGSFLAMLVGFVLFAIRHRHVQDEQEELNDSLVTMLLAANGLLQLAAASIAFFFRVGANKSDAESLCRCPQCCSPHGVDNATPGRSTEMAPDSSTHEETSARGNCLLVVIFQLVIVAFAMRGPIESITSSTFWICLLLFLVAVLAISLWKFPIQFHRSHRVGVFLMARHSIPTCDYLMESYMYSLLQSTPMLLQTMSLIKMGVITLSSLSYGKLFTKYSRGTSLLWVIAATTVVASLVSLFYLILVANEHSTTSSRWLVPTLAILIGSLTTFAGEWQFLPDVVLATASVGMEARGERQSVNNDDVDDDTLERAPAIEDACLQGRCTSPNTTAMEYGTFIACIDFGDQVGSWLTVPLVTAMGISRDNGWAHLEGFILLTSILGMLSVLFIGILRY